MTKKLGPVSPEKMPRSPEVKVRCEHIKAMYEDDDSHMVWIAGYCLPGRPDEEVVVLYCDECVPPGETIVLVWRMRYMIATETDMRRILRHPAEVARGATSIEPVSEFGARLMEDEFSKDTKQ